MNQTRDDVLGQGPCLVGSQGSPRRSEARAPVLSADLRQPLGAKRDGSSASLLSPASFSFLLLPPAFDEKMKRSQEKRLRNAPGVLRDSHSWRLKDRIKGPMNLDGKEYPFIFIRL